MQLSARMYAWGLLHQIEEDELHAHGSLKQKKEPKDTTDLKQPKSPERGLHEVSSGCLEFKASWSRHTYSPDRQSCSIWPLLWNIGHSRWLFLLLDASGQASSSISMLCHHKNMACERLHSRCLCSRKPAQGLPSALDTAKHSGKAS